MSQPFERQDLWRTAPRCAGLAGSDLQPRSGAKPGRGTYCHRSGKPTIKLRAIALDPTVRGSQQVLKNVVRFQRAKRYSVTHANESELRT
jgi:hypothetical protein